MLLLLIETSTHHGSVAISRGEEVIASCLLPAGVPQAASLAPCIRDLMAGAAIPMSALEGIAVSAGPGSYTGLRVGSSTAKGLAYSLGIRLIGIPGTLALAAGARLRWPEADYHLPMIDARRLEVYTALYDAALRPVWGIRAARLDDPAFHDMLPRQGRITIPGDGAKKIPVEILQRIHTEGEPLEAHAGFLAGPATAGFRDGLDADPLHFVPDYHKPPNITTPKNRGNRP